MKVIRVSSSEELGKAYEVRFKVFVDEQNIDREIEIDKFEDCSIHFLVLDNGQPIGTGRVRRVDNYLKVERICVLSNYRGKGIGELIMAEADDIAREKGLNKLKLHAQVQARRFYEKCGYSVEDETVFDDAGIPHLTMIRIIR